PWNPANQRQSRHATTLPILRPGTWKNSTTWLAFGSMRNTQPSTVETQSDPAQIVRLGDSSQATAIERWTDFPGVGFTLFKIGAISLTIRFVFGSILSTAPSWRKTQTAPSPTARTRATVPRCSVSITRFSVGSILTSISSLPDQKLMQRSRIQTP